MKRLLLLLCLPLLCYTQTFSQRSDSTIIRYLQQEYDIPFSTNNRVVVFKTGQEKFDDLFAAARARAAELVQAADGYMAGRVSYASLRALHGGASYDSGMSWQTSCAPSQAPGVRKKAGSARSHFRTA